MMKNKGFTLLELIVSFVLITVLSLALFRTVLGIQKIQKQTIYQNQFKSLSIVLNNEIQNDFYKDKITSVTACGTNCYDILYQGKGTVRISIDRDNDTIRYGDIKEKLPEGYILYDDLDIEQFTTSESGYNSYFVLTIPIKSSLESNLNDLKYIYLYDSTGAYHFNAPINGIYTVRRQLGQSSAPTGWERMDSAVGLVANATKNGTSARNDFDNIYPWSEIISYNFNTSTNSITAYYGDSNFKFDGSNGEVLTKIPKFYYRRYQQDGYEYISISGKHHPGYSVSQEFSVGRYNSSYDGTKLHSVSGAFPEVKRTITSFRTLSQAVGTNFGQMDYHYFLLQMLYLVEYADYDSQSKLGSGLTNLRADANDKALIAESSTNRIVINTTGASLFVVGQDISIGNGSVASNRRITAIADYSNGSITGKSITFDGAAVNIAVGDIIASIVQRSGKCDSLGMKSGFPVDGVWGKSCVIYRGIENIFGNAWQYVDGINVQARRAYINYNPNTYASDVFTGDYVALGYTNATSSGYVGDMGCDANNPIIALPINVNGGTARGVADDYSGNSGNTIVTSGGDLAGNQRGGLFAWNIFYGSGATNFWSSSRLLRY